MKLVGRRVLVTGASRGIGEAMARCFAAAGARVGLVARSEGAIKELARELDGTAHPADLADPAQVDGLIGRLEADGGPIDVLVNNAGIDLTTYFPATPETEIRDLLQVNLVSPVMLSRQVIPLMLERGGGHIVNVSSLAGCAVFPGLVSYSTSKAGLSQFTAGLRADLKGLPIGTTLVELGPVPTEMLDRTDDYAPTADSFRRFKRLQLLADVPRDVVAVDVVRAVEHNRRHVRHPKRALVFPLATEFPRRFVELVLSGVRPRPD